MPLIVHASRDYCTKTFAKTRVHWECRAIIVRITAEHYQNQLEFGSLTITDAYMLSNKNLMHEKFRIQYTS